VIIGRKANWSLKVRPGGGDKRAAYRTRYTTVRSMIRVRTGVMDMGRKSAFLGWIVFGDRQNISAFPLMWGRRMRVMLGWIAWWHLCRRLGHRVTRTMLVVRRVLWLCDVRGFWRLLIHWYMNDDLGSWSALGLGSCKLDQLILRHSACWECMQWCRRQMHWILVSDQSVSGRHPIYVCPQQPDLVINTLNVICSFTFKLVIWPSDSH